MLYTFLISLLCKVTHFRHFGKIQKLIHLPFYALLTEGRMCIYNISYIDSLEKNVLFACKFLGKVYFAKNIFTEIIF